MVDNVNQQELHMPTILITGGHAGLGLACAKRLSSSHQCSLVLAGRSPEAMERAAQQLRSRYAGKVHTLALDLSSLASVRAAAARCRAMLRTGEIESLQALLLNAGAQFHGPLTYSAEDYEETFAINCLGHFLFVNLLLDCVEDGGRIVWTASGTHDPETMDGKSVGVAAEPDAYALADQGKNGTKPLSGGKRYSTSKLCTMLYAYELDRKLRGGGSSLASIVYCPGFIPESGLSRTAPKAAQWLIRTSPMKWLLQRIGINMGSLPFSGAALVEIAVEPRFAGSSGKYLQSKNGHFHEARSSIASYDEQSAAKLWRDSSELVHLVTEEQPKCLEVPAAAYGYR